MTVDCGPRPAARPAARPATRPAARRDAAPVLRLTRRGRLAVGALLLVAAAVAVLLLNRPAQAGSQVRPVTASYHVVLPGETLWGIAGEVAPDADPRTTVDRIVEFNALDSVAVSAGQRIAVPGDLGR